MRRRPEQPLPTESPVPSARDSDVILHVKVWLTGISPMVWRRVLVPAAFTLRELHGVIQLAMGWESIHLYQFHLRAARYGSWEASAASPDVTLAAFQLREGARFGYEYDLNIPWRHEIRIEDRLALETGKPCPICTGGAGACPSEDCGGPADFMRRRDDRLSLDALEDLGIMAEIIGDVVLERRPEILDDDDTRWRLEQAIARSQSRERAQGRPFSRADVNTALRDGEHRNLMRQHY